MSGTAIQDNWILTKDKLPMDDLTVITGTFNLSGRMIANPSTEKVMFDLFLSQKYKDRIQIAKHVQFQ